MVKIIIKGRKKIDRRRYQDGAIRVADWHACCQETGKWNLGNQDPIKK
jgi:hypothetical protein